ncbi:cyclophilin-like fold protein [Domibacillus sp. DTU_2020_1001157_1_SI_ALB_TIR_016]|uniref:cyclophilin-like fold protein n=1 Tax=Domibacillus sp. DTU_2020_1001157_1_SI_ALB_TIR_016 TaxID=3077789 RepID=UPI0028EE284A|nr:cyclophilin-like fold protein [Domibacillus sp. DTU_2020_1001157_1_SI_ALB_TIR_016]WNS78582.1 cyclophilin-like fold protein [Domibacillus sp. DTU_2020_1001157_1_SI_ALB_TIR_016]
MYSITTQEACGNSDNGGKANDDTANTNSSGEQLVKIDEPNKQNGKDSIINNGGLVVMEDAKVKLTFSNEEVLVNMYDNPTSRDFLSQLPLTITLEDYAQTEKISYLSKKLSTEKASSGSEPLAGDFTYYAPRGNLAIFYKDFGYSNGLIKLGKIESGVEKFESIKDNFTVQIEKID